MEAILKYIILNQKSLDATQEGSKGNNLRINPISTERIPIGKPAEHRVYHGAPDFCTGKYQSVSRLQEYSLMLIFQKICDCFYELFCKR